MRAKPENADYYGWVSFEKYADENGIGEHEDDWTEWWNCWKAGYICAMQG